MIYFLILYQNSPFYSKLFLRKTLDTTNCKTAVLHNRKHEDELNSSYRELAEHYGDGLDRRASRLLYAFKKGIPEGCVDNFFGHKSPLSAPVLGVESGQFDLRKGGGLENALQKYTKPTLLIIDEWLLFKLRENEARLLLEMIHKRRKKSSTIFCSQFEEKDWYNQICDSESTLADAIMDRISFDCTR